MNAQPSSFNVNRRIELVKLNFVRVARRLTAERVIQQTESGALLWVFNVSARKGRRRELRFWLPEIYNPHAVASFNIETVLSQILPPTRSSFGTSEIRLMFMLGRATAFHLAKRIGKKDEQGHLRIKRDTLARFLRQRWIGRRP